jgi:hypothetical protein
LTVFIILPAERHFLEVKFTSKLNQMYGSLEHAIHIKKSLLNQHSRAVVLHHRMMVRQRKWFLLGVTETAATTYPQWKYSTLTPRNGAQQEG